jgi:hypothetical protein
MRSLNAQMTRVPQVSVTITGGLWFVVGSAELATEMAFVFMIFAFCANFGLAASCIRIRDAIQSYLEKIMQFSAKNFASGIPENPQSPMLADYSMIKIYVTLMCIAGCLSLVSALHFFFPWHHIVPTWLFLVICIAAYIFAAVFYYKLALEKSDEKK